MNNIIKKSLLKYKNRFLKKRDTNHPRDSSMNQMNEEEREKIEIEKRKLIICERTLRWSFILLRGIFVGIILLLLVCSIIFILNATAFCEINIAILEIFHKIIAELCKALIAGFGEVAAGICISFFERN